MKREIRDKRYELLLKSKELKSKNFDPQCENTDKVMEEQKSIYKKWNFYDKLIKAGEKVKKNV